MSSLLFRSATVVCVAIFLNIATSYFLPSINLKDTISRITHGQHQNETVLRLFGSPMSTCTRRVATVLKEKGVPYELVPIDFGKMEHKSAEYIATKQPFGQVPVLQDGDFIIYESRAISRYIAIKYATQGTPLIPPPSDIRRMAKFEEAASVEQNNFDPFASGIASEKVFKPMSGGVTDNKRVEDLTVALTQKIQGYERILSKQKYIAGDEITLADLFHLPYGAMITELGIDVLNSKPNVARWWKDITSRPSWKAVKGGA